MNAYRKSTVKNNETEDQRRRRELKALQETYGELLETCRPNMDVCEDIVEFIDSKLLVDPFVLSNQKKISKDVK